MAPWQHLIEAFLVQQLLRTPAFHRAVEKVAKNVHRIRHGTPPHELGGTKIDGPRESGFLGHFLDEVKGQVGKVESKSLNGGSGNAGVNLDSRAMGHAGGKVGQGGRVSKVEEQAARVDEVNADAAWREFEQRSASETPKQGFLGEYIEALRQQVKEGNKKT